MYGEVFLEAELVARPVRRPPLSPDKCACEYFSPTSCVPLWTDLSQARLCQHATCTNTTGKKI